MTEEDAQKLVEDLLKEFGNKLPSPEHFPESFKYYIRLLKYLRTP